MQNLESYFAPYMRRSLFELVYITYIHSRFHIYVTKIEVAKWIELLLDFIRSTQ